MMHAGHDALSRGQGTQRHDADDRGADAARRGSCSRPRTSAGASGFNNLRSYLHWQHDETGRVVSPPRFRVLDTPSNRQTLDVLEAMTLDPDDPEDALKVDADSNGQGGDDPYDAVRYGLAARPLAGKRQPEAPILSAWDPRVLLRESERKATTPLDTKFEQLAQRIAARGQTTSSRRRRAPIGGELA
jgi:hypothetical protein